jgi:hypothetical protein
MKEDVLDVLPKAHRVCRVGGRVLILQPNIRYVNRQYWDFFDHHTPLTDRSLVAALKLTGFEINKIYPKFLPYTTKSTVSKHDLLVKVYLRVSLTWRLIGKQAFVVGQKSQ